MEIAFIVIDESTLTGPEFGGELTQKILADIAKALDAYANEDVAPVYGGGYVVRPGKLEDADGHDTCAVRIVDGLPNVPGAAALHDRTDTGAAIIWVARDEFSSLTDGPSAMSEGIGHEIVETIVDPGANRWVDRTDGTEEAMEAADRLQGSRYQKGGIVVPDFLLPSAFAPGSSRPFSKLDALGGIYDTTIDGYVILRSQGAMLQPAAQHDENAPPLPPGTPKLEAVHVKTVAAHGTGVHKLLNPMNPYEAAKLARKQHPISRSYARGVRL
jgi:hypothetical protein